MKACAAAIHHRAYRQAGFTLLQGIDLNRFGSTYEEMEATAKLFYLMLSKEVGTVLEQRGRLYDVINRHLNTKDENVLFSGTNNKSGYHTDSTDKDFMPDIVALMCLSKAKSGGKLKVTNAMNVYHRLRQLLPLPIFAELERPIVRDLIEKGLGKKDKGSNWERLRRSPLVGLQRQRLRRNRFAIFQRDSYTGQFTFRYMRYWVESGHQRANLPMSPMLVMALNALDDVLENDPTIFRIERVLEPGEIIYCNNHICAHDRDAYEDNPERPRHKVRVWIDFDPFWGAASEQHGTADPTLSL